MNFSMFCTVLAQLNSMKSQGQKTWQKMILHDLKGTASLAFLLGLTWGVIFFAWGPVRIFFLYLFAIFNTLQGNFCFFVFWKIISSFSDLKEGKILQEVSAVNELADHH